MINMTDGCDCTKCDIELGELTTIRTANEIYVPLSNIAYMLDTDINVEDNLKSIMRLVYWDEEEDIAQEMGVYCITEKDFNTLLSRIGTPEALAIHHMFYSKIFPHLNSVRFEKYRQIDWGYRYKTEPCVYELHYILPIAEQGEELSQQ